MTCSHAVSLPNAVFFLVAMALAPPLLSTSQAEEPYIFPRARYAVEPRSILEVPCKTKNAPSNQEMRDYLEKKKIGRLDSVTINGVSFQEEDLYLISLFQALHAPVATQVLTFSTSCSSVICAMSEIYGDERAGLQLLYLLARYGISSSHFNNADYIITGRGPKDRKWTTRAEAIPWQSGDLEMLLITLSDFPEGLYPNSRLERINRETESRSRASPMANTLGNSITIYNPFANITRLERQIVLYHELSHPLYALHNNDCADPEWAKVAGWMRDKKVYGCEFVSLPRVKRPTVYASASIYEDFAETMQAYRYNGAALKKEMPGRYEYMKKIHRGIEYIDAQTCRKL